MSISDEDRDRARAALGYPLTAWTADIDRIATAIAKERERVLAPFLRPRGPVLRRRNEGAVMDPNVTLTAMRKRIEQARQARPGMDQAWLHELLTELADEAQALDSWLSQGGFPPDAWREGPDEHPEHIYVRGGGG